MTKKKKRRSKPAPSARTRSQGAVLADERKQYSKRFKPAARNLLLLNLVFLAVVQLLYRSMHHPWGHSPVCGPVDSVWRRPLRGLHPPAAPPEITGFAG